MAAAVSRRRRRDEGPDFVEQRWYFYVVCSHGAGRPVTRFPRWVLDPERLSGERHYDDPVIQSALGLHLDTWVGKSAEPNGPHGSGVKPARWRCPICRADVTVTWRQLDDLVAEAYAAGVPELELPQLAARISSNSRAGESSVNN